MKLPKGYIVSYAQNREDRIIDAFFPDVRKGFYVDIGANDPEEDSVTKLFYDKGWSGVNIEPNPTLFQKLKRARKRDINLPIGISSSAGSINFREYINHGLSTFSELAKEQNIKSSDPSLAQYRDYRVEVHTLKQVLQENAKNKTIHFLKIDVEGYEYEVIAGNDWSKFRPELLCIEANHVIQDWRPLVKKANYELVFSDGLNEYYLRGESLPRREMFDYANSMILSGIIVNPGVAKRIAEAEKVPQLESENNRLKEENSLRNKELERLSFELARYTGLKYASKKLLANIFRRVINRHSTNR